MYRSGGWLHWFMGTCRQNISGNMLQFTAFAISCAISDIAIGLSLWFATPKT